MTRNRKASAPFARRAAQLRRMLAFLLAAARLAKIARQTILPCRRLERWDSGRRRRGANGGTRRCCNRCSKPCRGCFKHRCACRAKRQRRTGAVATGSLALGSFALGAGATGAAALGAVAIRRLVVRRASAGTVEVRELSVERLEVGTLMIAGQERGAPQTPLTDEP